jgi:ATP-dependent helicase/nuclease subunit B
MAILLRAPETYASLMEGALKRAGIPAYFARGSRRPDPSGRALLALLECAGEGLSARRFAEYLSFARFQASRKMGPLPWCDLRHSRSEWLRALAEGVA